MTPQTDSGTGDKLAFILSLERIGDDASCIDFDTSGARATKIEIGVAFGLLLCMLDGEPPETAQFG